MNISQYAQLAHDIFSAFGVFIVAMTAVLHALRGLAAVLRKAAAITPTTQDDEILEEADKGLEYVAGKLEAAAEHLKRVAVYRK
jgi:hypothetical protein